MLTKETIIERLREQQSFLGAEYGVKRMGLFGSVAQDLATDESDIDMVVEFERPIGFKFIELVEYLEQLLGRNVDLLTPVGIQDIRVSGVAGNIMDSIVYV